MIQIIVVAMSSYYAYVEFAESKPNLKMPHLHDVCNV
jgi:hypothetical protein